MLHLHNNCKHNEPDWGTADFIERCSRPLNIHVINYQPFVPKINASIFRFNEVRDRMS